MSRILRTPFEKALAMFFLLIVGLVIIFPFIYMFASSLKESGDARGACPGSQTQAHVNRTSVVTARAR